MIVLVIILFIVMCVLVNYIFLVRQESRKSSTNIASQQKEILNRSAACYCNNIGESLDECSVYDVPHGTAGC